MNSPLGMAVLDAIDSSTVLTDAMTVAAQLLLGALVCVGVLLCLFGRRVARPLFAASGLALGALIGHIAGEVLQVSPPLVWIIGGALAGCALAWILFRVWMGITLAAVLLVLLPAIALAWENDLPPQPSPDDLNAVVSQPWPAHPASPQVQEFLQQMQDWWTALDPGQRKITVFAALAGVVSGLVFGLVAPRIAAAVISATLGALLIVLAGRQLLVARSGDLPLWVTQSHITLAVMVGLITLLGVTIQYTILRPRADRK